MMDVDRRNGSDHRTLLFETSMRRSVPVGCIMWKRSMQRIVGFKRVSVTRIRSSHGSNLYNACTASFHRRTFAIYAVGEGWMGALTQNYVLETIPGHFDEEVLDGEDGLTAAASPISPVCIYPGDDIQQVAVGWGTTALIDTSGSLKVVGRPHDVMSLLRMNRMPTRLRDWILRQQLKQQDVETPAGQAICDAPTTSDTTVTPVGAAISNLIGWATGVDDSNSTNYASWDIAKKYSYLADWTSIEMPKHQLIQQVACGPGLLAFISTEGGILYAMGVNNRGQCGTGTISNNVWTPTPVVGLTTAKKKKTQSTVTDQEHPIVQVALGFQHGYALDKNGNVFSWGKAQRGQLGRDDIDYDQDACAGRVVFPNNTGKIVEIAAGHHHGAALTQNGHVYVWGKNMGRNNEVTNDDSETPSKPSDARTPQLVQGLPTSAGAHRISCGSHHTSILMDNGSVYAMGIASDEAVPVLKAVEIIPEGILELPVRQFEAHQDRTTVVDRDGNVYQSHLWLDGSLREYAYFTPSYVDELAARGKQIQSIHRGWRHTAIVTAD
jgi:hypothetical protein